MYESFSLAILSLSVRGIEISSAGIPVRAQPTSAEQVSSLQARGAVGQQSKIASGFAASSASPPRTLASIRRSIATVRRIRY